MRPRVLIVDDDLAIRRALARELRSDFDVVVVTDFDQASAELDGPPFAAVVSDFELGVGPDGVALLAMAAERRPDTLRILISASRDRQRIDEALEDGITHRFLAKPWPPGELLATLNRYSRSGTMRRVRQSSRPGSTRKRSTN